MGLGLDELAEFGGDHHLRRRCAGRHDIVVEEELMVLRIPQVHDPCDSIEVRMFGWDRLTPGSVEEHTPAIAALLRNRFVFDGDDWVWRRSFTVPMVPVAAHLFALTLIDTWDIHPGSVEESLLATGTIPRACERCERCDRCLDPECAGHR